MSYFIPREIKTKYIHKNCKKSTNITNICKLIHNKKILKGTKKRKCGYKHIYTRTCNCLETVSSYRVGMGGKRPICMITLDGRGEV